MALRNKFLSPTCAPAHGDIAPYFFSKIYFDPMEECVFQWRRFGPEEPNIPHKMTPLNTYSSIGSKYFFEKKVCGDISMSRRTCWWKEFVAKFHPAELSVKYRDFVRNCGFFRPKMTSFKHTLLHRIEIFFQKKSTGWYLHEQAHILVKGFCC